MSDPEDFVVCRVCGKEFQMITHSHLKKHGMTLEAYRREFLGASMISGRSRKKYSESSSAAMTEYYKDPEHRAKLSGENNPTKRPEVRAKISATQIEYWKDPENIAKLSATVTELWKDPKIRDKHCGENNSSKRPEVRAKLKAVWTAEKRAKRSVANRGKNNPSYIDGRSFLPYCHLFDEPLRESYRNYWGRICVLTDLMKSTLGPDAEFNGTKFDDFEGHEIFSGRRLSVHHIYGNKMAGCDDTELALIPLQISYNAKKIDGLKLEDHPFYITLFMFKDLERKTREQRINGS